MISFPKVAKTTHFLTFHDILCNTDVQPGYIAPLRRFQPWRLPCAVNRVYSLRSGKTHLFNRCPLPAVCQSTASFIAHTPLRPENYLRIAGPTSRHAPAQSRMPQPRAGLRTVALSQLSRTCQAQFAPTPCTVPQCQICGRRDMHAVL